MKKILVSILAIVMLFGFQGCSNKNSKKEEKKQQQQERSDSFNSQIAINTVQNYMMSISKNDMNAAKKLSSKDLWNKGIEFGASDLNILGYKVEEVNEVGKSSLIKVKASRTVDKSPRTTLDTYSIKVIKEEESGEYQVSDVNVVTEKEAFLEGDEIRIRQKSNVKTNLLVDKAGIPQYSFSKNDKGKSIKISTPKANFGNMIFSYMGDKIAISTYDKDSFIGIIKIDESLMTQGAGGDNGGSGGAGGQENQGGSKTPNQKSKAREIPVGKELNALDILKNSAIKNMSFSLDEKYLMAQYELKDKGYGIRVYNVDNGKLIEIDIESEFPIEDFDVLFYSFDLDGVIFDVVAKSEAGNKNREKSGRWKINLGEIKLMKM
ncbi:hypothetical protein KQI89_10440 [Clostridium sp. MSJ-4]|uniref:Phage head-tail adaptor n=1 Tax=Clostridium simiarum TaxID=2841506 RepID=A0ABS6F2T9_9CLOT|nr:hypothetical protein [Clostridium simiarum]MBU5592179.1 hypothetical protein [Clostridium simiarum]